MSTAASPATDGNPLLQGPRLPPFKHLSASHVQPAITSLCATLIATCTAHEAALEALADPTYDTVVEPLNQAFTPLGWAWGVVNHLCGVADSPELRQAREAVQGEVVRTQLRVAQSPAIYRALTRLREAPAFRALDSAHTRIVLAMIRDAELSGVALQDEARTRFQNLTLELDQLTTRFQQNLLDAGKAFALVLTKADQVAGLPQAALAMAARMAKAADPLASGDPAVGPWRITLDIPSYQPFMEHAQSTTLRERLYRAFITRASHDETDNAPLVERILTIRREKALLLGRASHADVSLAAKMAPSVAAIDALFDELTAAARPHAQSEFSELTAFARSTSGQGDLELRPWDVPYWAERLREERYAYRDQDVRPYFALEHVLSGLFALAEKLFSIRVQADDSMAEVWDESVRFFTVRALNGTGLAAFYLDPYSRPSNKRGGAWMDVCMDRSRKPDGSLRLPVAYIICNQTPPNGDTPSLMTFREVETLFHEFGHALQHMLTTVEVAEAAGINNIEWDAVELPSQFMENWCFHWPTIQALAQHYQTKEPLPEELFNRIKAARTYRAGAMVLRQVALSKLDLELHHTYRPGDADGALAVQRRVMLAHALLPPLTEDRLLCSFSHIFAGGYSAGYYSYKWAEVLSADAFGAFEEAGLDDAVALGRTGMRFRSTVLAAGGSRHPLEVFRDFRGREPSVKPLLRQLGMA